MKKGGRKMLQKKKNTKHVHIHARKNTAWITNVSGYTF